MDATKKIDGKNLEEHKEALRKWSSSDVLYEHKAVGSSLPIMRQEEHKLAIKRLKNK